LITKNGNVKRGLAIRHRDLANLTGENVERKETHKGKRGIAVCINCLTIAQCV